jgi:hypothetical protein
MLYERKDLPELHTLKHRHDDFDDYVDYEKTILTSSLSPYMFNNNLMNNFILRLQPLTALLFDQMNVMKNFRNYTVDKYFYKHNG